MFGPLGLFNLLALVSGTACVSLTASLNLHDPQAQLQVPLPTEPSL